MSLFNFFNNKKQKQKAPVYYEPEDEELLEQQPLTLYTSISDKSRIIPVFVEVFQKWKINAVFEDEFSASFDLPDGGELAITVLTDGVKTKNRIEDIRSFFTEIPIESRNLQKSVANQISVFNSIIYTDIFCTKSVYNDIHSAVFSCAKAITAFVLTEDMQLFHSDGRLLINPRGETEFSEFHPISNADLINSALDESPADKARRERTVALLKSMNIPYITLAKSRAVASEVKLRDVEDIVGRLTSLFAVNIKAEVININDGYEHLDAMFSALNEKYAIEKYLTPRERQFLKNPNPISSEVAEYGWMYEATATLMWVLSLIYLPGVSTVCNVGEMSRIIWDNDFDSLCARARLLGVNEILEYHDQVFRMQHSASEARNNGVVIENFNESILYFRHYALNWILRVRGVSSWDDIKPNT